MRLLKRTRFTSKVLIFLILLFFLNSLKAPLYGQCKTCLPIADDRYAMLGVQRGDMIQEVSGFTLQNSNEITAKMDELAKQNDTHKIPQLGIERAGIKAKLSACLAIPDSLLRLEALTKTLTKELKSQQRNILLQEFHQLVPIAQNEFNKLNSESDLYCKRPEKYDTRFFDLIQPREYWTRRIRLKPTEIYKFLKSIEDDVGAEKFEKIACLSCLRVEEKDSFAGLGLLPGDQLVKIGPLQEPGKNPKGAHKLLSTMIQAKKNENIHVLRVHEAKFYFAELESCFALPEQIAQYNKLKFELEQVKANPQKEVFIANFMKIRQEILDITASLNLNQTERPLDNCIFSDMSKRFSPLFIESYSQIGHDNDYEIFLEDNQALYHFFDKLAYEPEKRFYENVIKGMAAEYCQNTFTRGWWCRPQDAPYGTGKVAEVCFSWVKYQQNFPNTHKAETEYYVKELCENLFLEYLEQPIINDDGCVYGEFNRYLKLDENSSFSKKVRGKFQEEEFIISAKIAEYQTLLFHLNKNSPTARPKEHLPALFQLANYLKDQSYAHFGGKACWSTCKSAQNMEKELAAHCTKNHLAPFLLFKDKGAPLPADSVNESGEEVAIYREVIFEEKAFTAFLKNKGVTLQK